ncbi:MAG TPA: hypothetical protein VJR89_40885, partial [Polyangiales bacterium]|nr:hypothetical protein [Polyangiales bacterium]
MLASSNTVVAEGSADLDAADTLPGSANDQALTQTTTLYVDLNGTTEQICWRGNGSLQIYQPNGTTAVGAAIANNNCRDGVNGVDGAYVVDMLSDQNIGTEWDIRVCDKTVTGANCRTVDANEKLGRLWSYNWIFEENTSFAENRSNNGSVYALVSGGGPNRDAVIEMQMRGVSGAQYSLKANTIGPQQTDNTRVGRSVPEAGHKVIPTVPLYLNLPAKAQLNWLPPEITSVTLMSSCGGRVLQGGTPGTISFNGNVTGQYVLICDVDKNSVYDFAASTDFSSFGDAVVGANTVNWNGTTNAGGNASPGQYQCVVRLNVGEFHYDAEDIETSYPGIRMFRVEQDRTTRTGIPMFWDDSGVTADGENMPNSQASPNASPALGLAPGAYSDAASAFFYMGGDTSMPVGNARAWGNYDADGKGNNAFLDQFASADSVQSTPFSVTVLGSMADADSDGL